MVSDTGQDLYQLLGLKPGVSNEEIKKAYRRLAHAYHPDTNPNNTQAHEQFERVSEAYCTLKDPKQRAEYDRLARYNRPTVTQIPKDQAKWKTALSSFFEQVKRTSGPWPKKGGDLLYNLRVSLMDAVRGGRFWIESPAITVSLPADVEPGARLRFLGKGLPGRDGGPPGDLIVVVNVDTHPWLHRQGFDLVCKRPLPFPVAALGGEIQVPTPEGQCTLKVPAGSQHGSLLRLQGKGLIHPDGRGRGDLLIELEPEMPVELSDNITQLLQQVVLNTDKHNYPKTQDFEKSME